MKSGPKVALLWHVVERHFSFLVWRTSQHGRFFNRVFFFGQTFLKKSLVTLYKIEKKMQIEVFGFILVYGLIA